MFPIGEKRPLKYSQIKMKVKFVTTFSEFRVRRLDFVLSFGFDVCVQFLFDAIGSVTNNEFASKEQ